MFKFNFDTSNSEYNKQDDQQDDVKLIASEESIELAWDAIALTDNVTVLKGRLSDEQVSKALNNDEVLNSDLVPGKYEGGFKLWEGGIDLARYLVETVFDGPISDPLRVIELGCGHGLPGIVATLAGATVDYQDYNAEVLQMLTVPTVLANWRANHGVESAPPPVRYFSGDWGTLGSLLEDLNLTASYDMILTTETIYTLDGMSRLFKCIKQCLRPSGVCYVGAKSFYFGVGGGVAAFVNMIEQDGEMTSEHTILYYLASKMRGGGLVRLGFVGVGKMGSHMASNLLRAGYKLFICDSNKEATTALQKQGAQIAESPAELGAITGLRAIFSMLPSPHHVKDAYLGPHGILSSDPGTLQAPLLVDSSTIDPGTAREVAEAASSVLLHPDAANAFSRRNPSMIDAPVSGGVPGAIGATLTFMCGGDAAAVKDAEQFLMHMGKRVVHCGDHGSGQAAKLANNLALAIQMAGVAEGLAFGLRQGLDPQVLTNIFNSSSAQCWSSEKYNPVPGIMEGVPSSRGYQGGFSTGLMLKDLRLALETADPCNAKLPMTKAASAIYQEVADKAPGLDFSSIYKFVYTNNDS